MKESGQAKEFLDVRGRRELLFKNLKEGGINLLREGPCDMHGSKGVLETSMFGCRKYPTRTLQLEDISKPLDPRGIDHIPFGFLPLDAVGHHNIVINGICD
jgi:hypothetical protein